MKYTIDAQKLLHDMSETFFEYQDVRKKLGRENKPDTLMELATMGTRFLKTIPDFNPNIKNVVESDEINACTFKTTVEMEDGTTEEREIMFKNETHNHPTEIEPFGGAATCL